ncbi:conserved hypothetical protein [Solidesulfovibrio fructosivorans JJ]]|uniref:Uncharacterized protein n=1 Tax=Solidesulfovibrio fructosivorans JJ] TaxID=596151 RepID=E1JZ15_SOLFR|nr:outer membrane beta-barrel protein [Solidesulfovibrio fructosivorans]EFL50431.1 conserved hypothetical protein [Solidesulfovibrio fructosivorans JJ]]
MKRRVMILAACVLLLGAGAVPAQEYTKGTTYLEPRGGVYGTTNPNVNTIGTYGGAAGYYVMDGVAVEAEGLGYAVDQQKKTRTVLGEATQSETTNAVSVAGMARWNFLRTHKGTLFVGAGGGGVFSDKKLPYNGETGSGMGQADLGASVALGKNVSLKAAGRFQHMGSFSDSGLDSLGGNVGLKISF